MPLLVRTTRRIHFYGYSITGVGLGPGCCRLLSVADEVEHDWNSCPAELTVVWAVPDSGYARQSSDYYHYRFWYPLTLLRWPKTAEFLNCFLNDALQASSVMIRQRFSRRIFNVALTASWRQIVNLQCDAKLWKVVFFLPSPASQWVEFSLPW